MNSSHHHYYGGMPGSDGSITISQHNQDLRVRQETSSLVIKGHNNRIRVETSVSNIVLTGHNNKVTGGSEATYVENIAVTGHNNRIENMQLGNVIVNGHNNCMKNLVCQTLTETGFNNKFVSCQSQVTTHSGGGHQVEHGIDGAPEQFTEQYAYESEESEGGSEEEGDPDFIHQHHQGSFPFGAGPMPGMPGMPSMPNMPMGGMINQDFVNNIMGNISSMFGNIQAQHPFVNFGNFPQ